MYSVALYCAKSLLLCHRSSSNAFTRCSHTQVASASDAVAAPADFGSVTLPLIPYFFTVRSSCVFCRHSSLLLIIEVSCYFGGYCKLIGAALSSTVIPISFILKLNSIILCPYLPSLTLFFFHVHVRCTDILCTVRNAPLG